MQVHHLSLVLLITLPLENKRNKVNNRYKYCFNSYSSVAALNDVLKLKQYSDLTISTSLVSKSLNQSEILSVNGIIIYKCIRSK